MTPHPALAAHIDAFIRHRTSLGLRYRSSASVLRGLQRWIDSTDYGDLDCSAYRAWSLSLAHLHPNSRRKAQQVVRTFCTYRATHEPACFVPRTDTFVRAQPYRLPLILEPGDVARMLEAADTLDIAAAHAFVRAAARIALVLLYTTGLRRGELLSMRISDVHADGSMLFVADSKFHRSRYLPLSPSAQRELAAYLGERSQATNGRTDLGFLLCHPRGRRLLGYSTAGFRHLLRRISRLAGVAGRDGRPPRCHDLRHTFAVQSLARAYRAGSDVKALLPKLAVYMGHVSIESTAFYLRLVPAVAALASQRFEACCGHLGEATS